MWLERRAERRRYLNAALDGELYAPGVPRPVAFVGYPPDWDVLRRRVNRHAKYRCQNCGAGHVEPHAHHIVPLSVGGTNALSNFSCLCSDCYAAMHPHMR